LVVRLAGKVAIITGAASGIGAATARLFATEGAQVIVADSDADGAAAVADAIGTSASAFRIDVRHADEASAMIEACHQRFGGLDILVNNAGRGIIGTVETTSEADWDDILAVNLKSVYLCAKYAVPALRARGGGVIVNTASNVAMAMAIKDRAAYVAAKGGVAALTRAMALDFAADNIRVNAVAPGVIWTSYYDRMLTAVDDPEAFKAGLKARSPVGQWGEPGDIAAAILYLASDESRFATGSMLTVDGGASIW
jgi:NAD(P)-dependent dehydrogenase (short-subunit alcohol dehydrogenase family)